MVKLNKIYTRTGDAGESGLVDGSRRAKSDMLFTAVGDVDEANSLVGLARLHTSGNEYDAMLARIQHDLFDLGADLANPFTEKDDGSLRVVDAQVIRLEQEIDELNEALTPLSSFVLPGGSVLSTNLHMARAVSRRAERAVCELGAQEPVNPVALKYLNRLSDFLFVLARVANDHGKKDVLWKPGVNR